jgi:hypothetical protein
MDSIFSFPPLRSLNLVLRLELSPDGDDGAGASSNAFAFGSGLPADFFAILFPFSFSTTALDFFLSASEDMVSAADSITEF